MSLESPMEVTSQLVKITLLDDEIHVFCRMLCVFLMVEATFLIVLDGSYVMIHNDLIYPNVCCFNPFFLVKPPPKPPPNCLGSAPQLRQVPAGSWSAPPAAGRLEPGPRAVWTAGRSRGRWGKRSVESWSIGYQICYVYIYIYYVDGGSAMGSAGDLQCVVLWKGTQCSAALSGGDGGSRSPWRVKHEKCCFNGISIGFQ